MSRVLRLGVNLMVVGVVAALALGLTYSVTKDKMAAQKRQEEIDACAAALPGAEKAGDLKEDDELTKAVRKRIKDVEKVFTCGLGDIIIVKAKGYGGPIRMAVGIGKDGVVLGASVISHNETPGLGADVEKPAFLDQFRGKKTGDRIEVGGGVTAITGATITSRAAAKEVRDALRAFEEITKGI